MTTDEQIAQLCDTNPDKGFELLVSTYQQRVYWHIRRMVVIHEDAEDLLQDVFVKIYSKWNSFRHESSMATWIYRIASNECLTFLNRQKMKAVTDGGDSQQMAQRLADSSMMTADSANRITTALQEAVQTLPETQRLVFNMRYYDDMSYKDIANVTGSSMSAAKTNYHIAKQKVTEYVRKLL